MNKLTDFFRRNFKQPKKIRSKFSQTGLTFEKLEPKNLLAGMYLNPANGDLTIWGDAGNDVGRVDVSGSSLNAQLTGLPNRSFDLADVSRVIFIGHAGNDEFRNNSGIAGLLYGNSGNDRLFGGDAKDVIVGANGDDLLSGGDDDDRLIGGSGADELNGEDGNDKMFGNSGVNVMNGGDGDDLMFGGDDSDTINGDAGIDTIIGLAGDDILSSGAGGIAGTPGATQADLILGLAGDDIFTGTSGLDIFYGGDGNDVMTGGSGENRMHGQNGNDQLTGGSKNDYLAGHNGNDEINGLGGNDYLNGGHNDDILRGGAGNDVLLGGIHNDSLYGESGVDSLDGESGNDGLFGGIAGIESLKGGSGADRFLIFGNDSPSDLSSADATITFVSDGSNWSDKEIEVADVGLRQLHHRTGSTRIFVDPLDPNPMTLYKVKAGALGNNVDGDNVLNWEGTWQQDGTIISESYTRLIRIADWNESDQSSNENVALTVIHEIGHSFDSAFELQEALGAGSIWNSFLRRSGWETSNPGAGHTKAPGQTQEPFDRVYVAPNYNILTRDWWRDNSAQFARNYGTTNPKEDWSTVWESIFVDAIVENPNGSHANQVPSKVSLVNSLLDMF